jgi:NAD(P)-dependent dehydrogenase (short-subunit alcohol dehydrogenase family)
VDKHANIPSKVSPEGFLEVLKINVVAQTAVTQAILPFLQKKSTKKVVFMSSLMGSLAAMGHGQKVLVEGGEWNGPSNKHNMVYSTAKAALSMTALVSQSSFIVLCNSC